VSSAAPPPYASRAGVKLAHALDAFGIDVTGRTCADFGANVGGFTDCLLRRGAGRVYAVETGYGVLAWTLRRDARVVVMERTNALHAPPPPPDASSGGVDLVAVDLGWTPQRLAVPAALRWLRAPAEGDVVTLVKPHYEAGRGSMEDAAAAQALEGVLDALRSLGAIVVAVTTSPIRGAKSARGGSAGNVEYLLHVRAGTPRVTPPAAGTPAAADSPPARDPT
jgi:23S rRNA (cytidine1920-2'-O)/16S rRNA (cytidine1409-2'-O)-methyltransferase